MNVRLDRHQIAATRSLATQADRPLEIAPQMRVDRYVMLRRD